MSKKSELPPGWLEVEFGDLFSLSGDDIVDGPFGSNLKASEYVNEGIPIARLQNIDRNQFVAKNTKYVTREKAEELARHTFMPGDILITKLGDPLGKACLAPANIEKGVLVADVVRARITHSWVDRRFLCYQINADNIAEQFKEQTKGTTRPRVNLTKIRTLKARLCPLPEQIRIVEKLEELLTDLDAGVAELMAAQEKLVQHRQSLLKAAVDGSLTVQWRAECVQRGEAVETGAQLLARILAERRTRWEVDQLAEFERQDKIPPQGWQDKYPEPVQADTTGLPALPDGWVWATLSQVGWLDRGRSKHRPRNAPYLYGGAYPFVQTGDIRDADTFVCNASSSYSEAGLAQSKLWPINTLCITIAANIGKTAILGIEACFPDSVVGFLPASDNVSVRFVEYFMRTVQQRLEAEAPSTAQKNINLEILGLVCLPLPPLDEQLQIVSIVSAGLRDATKQNISIELNLKQTASQRNNIFKSAFSGQLVPQNSNDEPASVLQEQIYTEKEAREKQPKIKKVRKDSGMKKFDVDSLREWIINQSDDQISFEEFRSAIPLDYEMLKDFVYQLLDENNPIIEQEFNQQTGRMSFKRVKS